MKRNRREILKTGALGAAALSVGGLGHAEDLVSESPAEAPLDILILGGTGFIGPHMVREALRRGHSVTLFNRGRSNATLFPDLETIIGDRDNGLDGLEGRRWDVVIDNSGYVPRHVRDSSRLLADSVSHYLFVSTVSVFASFSQDLTEDSPVGQMSDPDNEERSDASYGPMKALCEQAVRDEIGDERTTVLRPTYICGPGDHTDRFSYWPVRTSKGGEMIWPGLPTDNIQIIDVRDFANFTIDCVQHKIAGTYVTATPESSYSMGDLLSDCQAVTRAIVEPLWVDEDFAGQAQARNPERNWGVFPIWHPQRGANAVTARFIAERARAAGLRNRPVRETARDLMAWWQTLPEERTATLSAGMSAEFEAELIALWKKQKA